MAGVTVGQQAPSFRLPSGQGPEVGPEDYRGRSNVIVWLTKGMACPFCRQHMSHLARGRAQLKALNTEILQVTPTPPSRARFYAQKFTLPFPYLCDPDNRVRAEWGLGYRPHSLAWYASKFYGGMTMATPPSDFGKIHPAFGELPNLLADDDEGFFILDRQGIVRYARTGSYMGEGGPRGIPSNEEIIRELERCEKN
jgi:peroxiredoxin